MSSSYLVFSEDKIKRFKKLKLTDDEIKNSRVRVTKEFLNGYDSTTEIIEVIRREK